MRADSTDANTVRRTPEGIWELRLPQPWVLGLDPQIPGWDAGARLMRITEDMNLTRDADGHKVGFLGRAHPIVARALDRVRNIRFGSNQIELDRRIAAAYSDTAEPALLYTFLGRVQSEAGREFERVIAVLLRPNGERTVMLEPAAWLPWTESDRAAPSARAWEQHFQAWARADNLDVQAAAVAAFAADPAAEFFAQHGTTLAEERRELQSWLRTRTNEICGPRTAQEGLFAEPQLQVSAWRFLADDAERLAAFATDASLKPRQRSEASGVLEVYRRRTDELARRAALSSPEAVPLGLLMLVPREVTRG